MLNYDVIILTAIWLHAGISSAELRCDSACRLRGYSCLWLSAKICMYPSILIEGAVFLMRYTPPPSDRETCMYVLNNINSLRDLYSNASMYKVGHFNLFGIYSRIYVDDQLVSNASTGVEHLVCDDLSCNGLFQCNGVWGLMFI